MAPFSLTFQITEERRCPFYNLEEGIQLNDQSVKLPLGKPVCLILIRELTGLLFSLLPLDTSELEQKKKEIFTCGGCTGLIKFKITDKILFPTDFSPEASEGDGAVITGQVDAILPAELLQVFHMHQKTGRLIMEVTGGAARITFREGGLLAARFEELDNQEAIYALLSEKKGTFRFIPGLPDSLMQAREIGDFMMILMEGLKRLDEDER
ncbi:DUF4388 domain-containing protein [Desulfogranum japonicum]|uniref:DUF4388 domain-containing protein n=1 Tax=Desulfogranum japonicum TaxID=231447 RepID=UPI00040B348D|nr:DUF4388 domain-containing protein [Desulfogranum japonicum]